MRAGHLLLLAIGVACLALAQGSKTAPYLLSGADPYLCVGESISEPDQDKVEKARNDAIDAMLYLNKEEKLRCKGFCKRIYEDVKQMEEVDKTNLEKDSSAQPKGCKKTAIALVKLADAVLEGDLDAVANETTAIHTSSCLAQLMSNWAARDAACHREETPEDQRSKIINRAITILVQFYGKALTDTRRNGEVQVAGELEIEGRRALGAKKKIGKDGLDASDFCTWQVAKWKKDHNMVLFDPKECNKMHPMYNDMSKCSEQCWKSMKERLNGNGCVSLYYQIMFDMIKSSRMINADTPENPSTDDALLPMKDDKKLNKLPEGGVTVSEGCTSIPCASIYDTIAYCASAGGEDNIKYSSKVSKVDDYGKLSSGGLVCFQGMDCH